RSNACRTEEMGTTPQGGGPEGAAADVARLGLVRPPLVYLISLVSGVVIQLLAPFPFLQRALALPLGALLVAVAVLLFGYSAATFRAGTGVPAGNPRRPSSGPGPIALAGTRSIWRSPCCSSESRSGSTACGCWLRS